MVEKPSKIIKRLEKRRDKEFLPPHDPERPYKRRFQRTHMSWPVALLYSRDKNAKYLLIFLFIILAFIIIGGMWLLYYLFLFILQAIGQVMI